MSNNDLRERMRNILVEYDRGGDFYFDMDGALDALIAAGMGDVSAARERAEQAEDRARRAIEVGERVLTRERALQARIDAAEKFATSERDSIRGQYGASGSVYAGYASACDDFLAALVSEEPAPEPPKLDPQQVIDEHMQMVAHRVIDVFENADDEDTAEDIMQPVFEAIGLVQAFTHDRRGEVQK